MALTIPDLPVGEHRTDHLVETRLEESEGRIDLARMFGNDRDVELEIGVGKGRFLLLAAVARPETNFLGLEVARRFLARAIDRIGKRGLENVRLAHAEAADVLTERMEDGSLSAVHIYFPDPWPKKRHHKRRIVRPDVLDQLQRVLRPGSLARVATDHADYASWIRETFDAHPGFEEVPHDPALWEIPGMQGYVGPGVTNFEIKFRRQGRPIQRFAWRRT